MTGDVTSSFLGIITANSAGEYTVKKSGLYLFTASMAWDTNTTGSRWMRFGQSGATNTPSGALATSLVNPGTYLGLTANTVIQTYTWQGLMTANTAYGLYLYQNSGTTRTYARLATTLTLLA
jgi:hypothetical protein